VSGLVCFFDVLVRANSAATCADQAQPECCNNRRAMEVFAASAGSVLMA
jgi:hypothetical protein